MPEGKQLIQPVAIERDEHGFWTHPAWPSTDEKLIPYAWFFIVNKHGKRMSWPMLRNQWADAREGARVKAEVEKKPDLANRIAQFQFRDIRPKAASEINDLSDASVLLGHSKEGITERVYRRVGAIAKPSK